MDLLIRTQSLVSELTNATDQLAKSLRLVYASLLAIEDKVSELTKKGVLMPVADGNNTAEVKISIEGQKEEVIRE